MIIILLLGQVRTSLHIPVFRVLVDSLTDIKSLLIIDILKLMKWKLNCLETNDV